MAGVRTAIIGETSTPFQGPSTPGHYTLNRGEPVIAGGRVLDRRVVAARGPADNAGLPA